MEAFDHIKATLATFGVQSAGEIVVNPTQAGSHFVPVRLSRSQSGRQEPSHKKLAEVKADLLSAGISIEFLLVDETAKLVEEALRGSLISSYPSLVRNAFLSVDEGLAVAWVESKRDLTEEERETLSNHIRKLVELYPVRGSRIHFTADENLATNTEILSLVRWLAPVGCEDLREELLRRDFAVPSLDWINRKFDALRRTGLLVRMPNRTYALTSEALHRLGTAKNRYSPDLSRLLALARRGG